MDNPRLEFGSVPVRVAAKVYGRDPSWIRAGIISGWLPIGQATRNGVPVPTATGSSTNSGRIRRSTPWRL